MNKSKLINDMEKNTQKDLIKYLSLNLTTEIIEDDGIVTLNLNKDKYIGIAYLFGAYRISVFDKNDKILLTPIAYKTKEMVYAHINGMLCMH